MVGKSPLRWSHFNRNLNVAKEVAGTACAKALRRYFQISDKPDKHRLSHEALICREAEAGKDKELTQGHSAKPQQRRISTFSTEDQGSWMPSPRTDSSDN
jgi:hypothetical protein